MSIPSKTHEYIHKSPTKMDQTISKTHNQDLILKATELRLGLPGSESPEKNYNVAGDGGGDGGGMKRLMSGAKRGFSDVINIHSGRWGLVDFVKDGGVLGEDKNPNSVKDDVASSSSKHSIAASKAQVVGWPPIGSFRKNFMAAKDTKHEDDPNAEIGSCVYVKVSMDGAPYLRKVDLKIYSSYLDLSLALDKMFSSFTFGQYGTHGVPRGEGLSENPLMDLLNGSEYVLTYEDKDGDLMLVGDVPWDMFTGSCKRIRIMKSSDAIGLAPRTMEEHESRNY